MIKFSHLNLTKKVALNLAIIRDREGALKVLLKLFIMFCIFFNIFLLQAVHLKYDSSRGTQYSG